MKIKYIFNYLLSLLSLQLENLKESIIFDTGSEPSSFGNDGFDIYKNQSIAVRFFSNTENNLKEINLYMMSNVYSEPFPVINLSLTKGVSKRPSSNDEIVEEFNNIVVNVTGWIPTKFTLISKTNQVILPGNFYWVIVKSDNMLLEDAIWCQTNTVSFTTFSDNQKDWYDGSFGSAPSIEIVSM